MVARLIPVPTGQGLPEGYPFKSGPAHLYLIFAYLFFFLSFSKTISENYCRYFDLNVLEFDHLNLVRVRYSDTWTIPCICILDST